MLTVVNMDRITVLILCICSINCCHCFLNPYPRIRVIPPSNGDAGKPLFLTPYIEAGKIQEGQTAAEVRLPGTEVKSYSGFLTVNTTYNSNMFFWYFPSEVDPANAPVILWLQGGPGGSSLFGLFCENGPFFTVDNATLKHRQYYWSQVFNVLYIDNPVGTGFSFTESEDGYVNDEVSVGRDLYSALSQFFRLFPYLQKNKFYLSGESYAGKYIPAIAYTIHTNNKISQQKINLQGLAIGDGFTDPEHMMVYADYLYEIGLIDSNGRELATKAQDEIVKAIQKKDFMKANDLANYILTLLGPHINQYNYLQINDVNPAGGYDLYLQSATVRKAIHVGNLVYNDGSKVSQHLTNDIMQSVRPWVEVLLENYRIMFYNGQLDIIVAYPLTVNFLQKLDWSGAETYKSAPRKQWMVGEEFAGYAKTAGRLTEVLVRNAGHMVPQDQPKWALDLITRFVYNKRF